MAIRQKGTKWQVDVTVAGVRAPRVNCDTRQAALKIEAEFRSKLLAGVPPEQLVPQGTAKVTETDTIDAVLTATHRAKWMGTKGEVTALYNGGVWATELGAEFPIADVTAAVVADVVDGWIAAGAKPGTINRKLSALSVMLRVAEERGLIEKRPKLSWRKEYEGRLRYYTDEEVDSLLEHAAYDPPLRRLFVAGVETGLRLGELQAMQARDVDLDARRVDLGATKGNRRAAVRLTGAAAEALRYMLIDKRDHDPVFPPHLNSRHISRVMAAWKRERGLPATDEACFHTFRHTTCSRLVQRGVPILVVKEFMRHANIETTMRYAHLAPDSLDLALAALEGTSK
jgi:integrase